MHTIVISEYGQYNGLPSSHILPPKSLLREVLVASEDSPGLGLSSEGESVDPAIDEQEQLHWPMVGWRILDLLISADISQVIVSEIIPPVRVLNDHLGSSKDPPMTILEAYIGMWYSNVKGIL